MLIVYMLIIYKFLKCWNIYGALPAAMPSTIFKASFMNSFELITFWKFLVAK